MNAWPFLQHDTKIAGQELQFVQESSLLLSFKRGANDQWLYNDLFRLDYMHEYQNHFSYAIGLKKWGQSPAGSIRFEKLLANGSLQPINKINTTEMSLTNYGSICPKRHLEPFYINLSVIFDV